MLKPHLPFIRYCACVLGLYACAAFGLLLACSIADAAHNHELTRASDIVGQIASYTISLILIAASAGVLFFAPIVLHPRNS